MRLVPVLTGLSAPAQPRVQQITQGVAQHVEPEHGQRKRHRRADGQPRMSSSEDRMICMIGPARVTPKTSAGTMTILRFSSGLVVKGT
jgi:hypothetical protein